MEPRFFGHVFKRSPSWSADYEGNDFSPSSGGYPGGMGPPYAPGPPYQGGSGGGTSSLVKLLLGGGCGCLTLVGVALVVFFGWAASLPESGAMPGSQIREETRQYMEDHGLIDESDRIIYFSDESLGVDNSELCFFTDKKIVYYTEDTGANTIYWRNVESVERRDEFLTVVILVHSKEDSFLKCEIVTGGNEFFTALEKKWETVKSYENENQEDEE